MKVLVTGGAGFIGSHIVDLLIVKGYEVVIVDNLSTGNKLNISNHSKLYETNILSNSMEQIFIKERPEIIIHQAAQVSVTKSMQDPVADVEANLLTTVKLLELSRKYKVKKFIFSSTSAVYGAADNQIITEDYKIAPISFYGRSKHAAELYICHFSKLYDIPYTIFRYSNVYGPRQNGSEEAGVIPIFIKKAIANEAPTIFGDGNQSRDFIFVKDIATANVLAIEKGHNYIFNLSTNLETTINELWDKIAAIGNSTLSPNYKNSRTGDIKHSVLSNDKAKRLLNWKPITSIEAGLNETYAYYLNNLQ